MSVMVTHSSAVNTWHCDQMGHMNVRHYLDKAGLATTHAAHLLGLGPRALAAAGQLLRTTDHHVRYHNELHAGAGLYIETSVLEASQTSVRLCHEVRRSIGDTLSATVTVGLELHEAKSGAVIPFPEQFLCRAAQQQRPLPAHAAPRGLELSRPLQELTLSRADQLGLVEIFRGVLEPSLCDSSGVMRPSFVISCISDGIPNLFLQERGKHASDPSKRHHGGAAVENRLLYYHYPEAGSLIVIRSGLFGLAEKTICHAHWMFDAETGEAVASAKAIAVSFDLEKRRAIPVPDAARSFYQTMLKPELARF